MASKRDKVRRTLMHGRTWRYLRYIHLRDALLKIGDDIESVGVVGAGHGYSEIALAISLWKNLSMRLTMREIG